ncbi:MAG: chromate efflux transporter [Chloroflexota bacterium]|nr:MAG: chromate efflux transporter [Chloroflexota bacterium]
MAQEAGRLSEWGRRREVTGLFLKLGLIAFGGPAAHIALMRDEIVRRRRWVTDQHFLDLLGATNLIPGPNSTEMAIHLGFVRAGWWGLVLAGTLFILPAMLIVLALAWAYVQFGSTPQAAWLLYGIKPVIIAIVVQALVVLARTAVKSPLTGLVVAATFVLYLLNLNEIALLFGGALLVAVVQNGRRIWARRSPLVLGPGLPVHIGGGLTTMLVAGAVPFSLTTLFLTFLKIGAVLYGSGYVLLAFLRADFVERLGWLTDQQLLDAIAIGQFTPGPVFTSATFVGYLVGGLSGAVLATVAIFLPSFVFVALSNPVIPRIRRSLWASSLLDGVNAAALGLMAAVTWQLGQGAIVDVLTALVTLLSLVVLIRFKPNSAWLVLAGGALGIAYHLVTR